MHKLASLLPDALIVAGSASVSYGTHSVYAPAGWIVGGAIALLFGYLAASRGN